jgi:hypothetical protein
MTQDEIIEMSRQVGYSGPSVAIFTIKDLQEFAKLVTQHEREACAKVCDDLWEDDGTAYDCAEAIRTLGQA